MLGSWDEEAKKVSGLVDFGCILLSSSFCSDCCSRTVSQAVAVVFLPFSILHLVLGFQDAFLFLITQSCFIFYSVCVLTVC